MEVTKMYMQQMEKCGFIFIESVMFDDDDIDTIIDCICEKYPNAEAYCLKDVCFLYCSDEGRNACLMFLKERKRILDEMLVQYENAIWGMEQ